MTAHTPTNQHQADVRKFLNRNVAGLTWHIQKTSYGTGQESYLVAAGGHSYFVKLGAQIERYRVMSDLGLSPKVVATGVLDDGTSILIQQQVHGRAPTRADFQQYYRKFARSLNLTHNCAALMRVLPPRTSDQYKHVGMQSLGEIQKRWQKYQAKVPQYAPYINAKIRNLEDEVGQFPGGGLVASHNDVCNGNWLVSLQDEKIYLLDYESMSLEDPALDLGAILWWYYPPKMRAEFLTIAGYSDDDALRHRMRVRMAIHNLNIMVPREHSFDRFSLQRFEAFMVDFKAVVEGKGNPQGYLGLSPQ